MKDNKPIVYWHVCTIRDWKFYIAATKQGVCYVGSPNQPFSELTEWVNRKMPTASLIQSKLTVQPFITELEQYFLGNRRAFTGKQDLQGTDFQQAVWHATAMIPYGETRTYSQIAEQINRPKAIRAVGTAIGANPLLFIIPCHRVIAKSGSLSGFRGGMAVKKSLLALEKNSVSV